MLPMNFKHNEILKGRWLITTVTTNIGSCVHTKGVCCQVSFSNSLILHQVKTKKISSVKEVWIPGLNYHRSWWFYFSICSLVFVSIEKIHQTLKMVFHRLSKHLKFHKKILRYVSYFQLSSRCLDIAMKHCRSYLIYYFWHHTIQI